MSATWSRDGTPDDAVSALVAYGRTHNARVEAVEGKVTLTFGSRLAYRIMGLATWRVPYVVQVVASAASTGSATDLTAEAYSNPGPLFVYRGESATLNYQRCIAATLDELRALSR
jgi:hypothetical protein